MTEMYAASREALDEGRSALRAELSSEADAATAEQVGRDLLNVVDVLSSERNLRGLLSDPSTEASARRRLAETVFAERITAPAVRVVQASVAPQWSSGRDLLDGIERLGREALLTAAESRGQLATVEDELFRLGRIVSGNPELEIELSNRRTTAEDKRRLLAGLLYGKVTSVTESLVTQAVGRLDAPPETVFDSLSALAASRRDQTIAHVRSSARMSEDQRRRLSESLARLYGRSVTVHVEVDPELLSGLVVRVGDEVIDGSGAGRLASVRKAIG